MISTIKAKNVDRVVIITNFEAICPITKTVDNYTLILEYLPSNGTYLELKSLREYLDSFKGKEIYHEDLACVLAEEICKAARPLRVTVKLISMYLGMRVLIEKSIDCISHLVDK